MFTLTAVTFVSWSAVTTGPLAPLFTFTAIFYRRVTFALSTIPRTTGFLAIAELLFAATFALTGVGVPMLVFLTVILRFPILARRARWIITPALARGLAVPRFAVGASAIGLFAIFAFAIFAVPLSATGLTFIFTCAIGAIAFAISITDIIVIGTWRRIAATVFNRATAIFSFAFYVVAPLIMIIPVVTLFTIVRIPVVRHAGTTIPISSLRTTRIRRFGVLPMHAPI
jgi:hypothetical protein